MFRYALVTTTMLVLSVSATAQSPWQPPRTPDGHLTCRAFGGTVQP